MMAHARKWIRPGGFLYIEVPDVRAAQEGPGREEFFIEHLHIFTQRSLTQTASKAGWKGELVEEISEPSGKVTLAAFFKAKE